MNKILFDTDILIDFLKGNLDSKKYIEDNITKKLYISVITVSELLTGCRNDKEKILIEKLTNKFNIIDINYEIAFKAGLYKNKYFKSHNIGLMDALIAATSHYIEANLISLNYKHYKMFDNIIVPYIK